MTQPCVVDNKINVQSDKKTSPWLPQWITTSYYN